MSYIKKILKMIKSILSRDFSYMNNLYYIEKFKKAKLNEKNIFIEPQQGRTINGNMFYILKELSENKAYSEYNLYIALKKQAIESANAILENNKIDNVKIVEFLSREYYNLLTTSKYLITDTSFLPFFVKKEGQVILNTWHGTPLKCLGKSNKTDYHSIGNVQKNFLIADYLLYPNQYTMEHMIEDYMLENICKAKVLLTGYPRNTAFFDNKSREQLRGKLNLNDKEILIYMPTWREGKTEEEIINNTEKIKSNLSKIDNLLKENQILYVNLHPLDKKNIEFEGFKNIKEFPKGYETYEFLNIADCLITDYSSVFFDYAVTRNKIVLFCYDEKEYLNTRGLYFDFNELPFSKANNIEDLIKIINSPKNYNEEEFIEKYCKYENLNVTKEICEKVILNKKTDLIVKDIPNNDKENILIYVGDLAKNGITSSIRNLLYNINTNEKNYIITFSSNRINKNKEQLLSFPTNVKYIATTGKTNMSVFQKVMFILYKNNIIPLKIFKNIIKDVYELEIQRLYGKTKFDTVIQFCGYEYKKILLYSAFDCNTAIYVHSDMNQEIKTRKIQHKKTLKYAYNSYNKVVVINKDLIEATAEISERKDNIYVANNLINYKEVLEKASVSKVEFDEETESNISLEDLNNILDNKDLKKIITIGRFSPEKGHKRLIEAFNKLYKENKDVYLIIVGGRGKDYQKTLKFIKNSDAHDNIIAIKSISNPYIILKKCDYFVLSSFYEGFGLVIAEADILNKPVISTNVIGPQSFLKENNGILVDNNMNGLYLGMKKLLNNEVTIMNVDYEQYNMKAIDEFNKIIEK